MKQRASRPEPRGGEAMTLHDQSRSPDVAGAGDADLVLRTRSGDRGAFGELWRRHYRAGVTVARNVTSSIDPDDLVQEAYTRIYQSILRGGGPTASFRAYLFTSIRNTAAAWGRSRHETSVDVLEAVEDPATSEQASAEALDRGLTNQAFRSLPTRWQEVLWYSEIERMKPAEIAPLLGMKPTAVAQLTFRAREGLREAWIQAHLRAVLDGSTCQWTIERMGAYTRHNLGHRDRTKLDSHLAECARCAIVASEARDVSGRLALVLLPLTVGVGATGGYLAALQGGGAPVVALAAMPSTVMPGAVTAGSGAGAVSAGSGAGTVGAAGAGTAGAAGAGASSTVGAASAAGAGATAVAGAATTGAAAGTVIGGATAAAATTGILSSVGAVAGIVAASVAVVGTVVAAAISLPADPARMTTALAPESVVESVSEASTEAGGYLPSEHSDTITDGTGGPGPADPAAETDTGTGTTAPEEGAQSADQQTGKPDVTPSPSAAANGHGSPSTVPASGSSATTPGAGNANAHGNGVLPVVPPGTPAAPNTPEPPADPGPPALPGGSPTILGGSTATGADGGKVLTISVAGAPGAEVQARVRGAQRATATVDSSGSATLIVTVSALEASIDARVEVRYVSGHHAGPPVSAAISTFG
jgi:RNA polymerase sigma factor (sigma-70 family)